MHDHCKQHAQVTSRDAIPEKVREVPCPDGKHRTVTITGYLPSLSLYYGWVSVQGRRVYGYVPVASFTLDTLHPNAQLMKGTDSSDEQAEKSEAPSVPSTESLS